MFEKGDIKKIKDVLLMTLDNNGEVFIQAREAEEYFNFQMNFKGGDKW